MYNLIVTLAKFAFVVFEVLFIAFVIAGFIGFAATISFAAPSIYNALAVSSVVVFLWTATFFLVHRLFNPTKD